MKSRKSSKRYWRYAFRKVISRYEEVRAKHGTSSCSDFYQSLGQNTAKPMKFNPRIVLANASDFIADVELAADKALRNFPAEKALFEAIYIIGQTPAESENASKSFTLLKYSAQEKVGRMFLYRKIFPLGLYFRPSCE